MSAVVIKLGGDTVTGPYMPAIAADVASLAGEGRRVVIVHGGGPQVTALQKGLGQSARLVGGRRVTDEAALEAVKMAVAGKVNVDLCAALLAAGARPVGLHGASSCVIRAVKRPPRVVSGGGSEPIDFGLVGDVVGVERELIALLLDAGHVPVLACLGASSAGEVFNINADVVAHRVAVELDAAGLVLVTDVPGVLRDVSDPASRFPSLTVAAGRQAIQEGTVTGGMIPKLEESFEALAAGVRAVHVVGRLGPGDLAGAVRRPGSIGSVLLP